MLGVKLGVGLVFLCEIRYKWIIKFKYLLYMKQIKPLISLGITSLSTLFVFGVNSVEAVLIGKQMIVESHSDWTTLVAEFSFDTDDFTDPNTFNASIQDFAVYSFDMDLNLLGLITSEDPSASGTVSNQPDTGSGLFGQIVLSTNNVLDSSLNDTNQDVTTTWNWDAFTNGNLFPDGTIGRDGEVMGTGANSFFPPLGFTGCVGIGIPPIDIVPPIRNPIEFEEKLNSIRAVVVDFREMKTPEPSLIIGLGLVAGLGVSLKKKRK